MIEIIKKSRNFDYNEFNNRIEFKQKAEKSAIVLPNDSFESKDKLTENLNSFLDNIITIHSDEKQYTIYTDSSSKADEIQKFLIKNGVMNSEIVFENLKDKIIGKTEYVIVKDNTKFNPRKFSDDGIGNQASKGIEINNNNRKNTGMSAKRSDLSGSSNRKVSYNKFDPKPAATLKLSNEAYYPRSVKNRYSLKELAKIHSFMKENNKFSFPPEWDGLELEEIISKNCRLNLDYHKNNQKRSENNYRYRALTNLEYRSKDRYFII